ncbi:C-type lectin domain family 1 member B-like isoform X3 [Tachysurus fulvidraco]|uniref:C-type lectin domain family 1 member B-like isoform X3 n=1 Tax=Tachysurus fulvidraco TaxID=1234273 RepID=UPI001FEE49C8|nr:C-type lectin domain family 1 member B-like isoform X3 [Tachysurus fulvidraco]
MQAVYEDISFDLCKMDNSENYNSPTDTEDDVYVNTEDCHAELKNSGSQAVDDDNVNTQQQHPKTKQRTASSRYNIIISALGLLLLGALSSLCAVGILYHNKVVSTEILSEGHENTTAELMVLKHKATDTERLYKELKAKHHEFVSACSETEKLIGMLKAKYQQSHERLSACNAKQNCTVCEEGWKSLGLKCYYFSNHKLNWTQSRDYCVEKGGHLVIITSQTEQDFLFSQIGVTHWIGLNDLETEGQWMWVNNQPLKETGVTFWYSAPKQPDNWKVEDPSGENCAALGNVGLMILVVQSKSTSVKSKIHFSYI